MSFLKRLGLTRFCNHLNYIVKLNAIIYGMNYAYLYMKQLIL